ncbi:hypothetical protein ABE527_18975 [Brucella sp. TWI432]
MAGPWEKYQTKATTGSAAPWEKYQALDQERAASTDLGDFSVQQQADQYEALRGPNALSDSSDGILGGIPFGDEAVSAMTGLARAGINAVKGDGFNYSQEYNRQMALNEELQRRREERSPIASTVGKVGGSVAVAASAAPAMLSTRFASAPLMGRIAAGTGDGLISGAVYGAGEGQGLSDRATNAGWGAVIGGSLGAAMPAIGAGASKAYEAFRNSRLANPIASQAGATPEALRVIGDVLEADNTLGAVGRQNMARAGQEAMLVDAGPTAQSLLDQTIQRSGSGARVARDAISQRVSRDSAAITSAMDDAFGAPTMAMPGTANSSGRAALSGLYNQAYTKPINYASTKGIEIEQMIKNRVPKSAIDAANNLMRVEGAPPSQQILAKMADDGSVVLERLPDVRRLDYITRGLNEIADQADGMGKLGGTTQMGRAYGNLSKDIRSRLKSLVPEYGQALDVAGTEIGKVKAAQFGYDMMGSGVKRQEVQQFLTGLPKAEKAELVKNIRQAIDDRIANVTRAVSDGDIDAREAIKALKDLSSTSSREKVLLTIGPEKSQNLFKELDRATKSFELRAGVTQNSKTYARQAMDERVKDYTQPGVIGSLARGEVKNTLQKATQAATGNTDDVLRSKADKIYSQIAEILTRQGGPGQSAYNAINQLNQTDATTLATSEAIRRFISPRLAYPATTQILDKRPR